MARIYEYISSDEEPVDVEGSQIKNFDPVTRRALIKFWIAAPGLIIAASILYYLSRSEGPEPSLAITAAIIVAVFALVLLFIMNRSLLSMRVVSQDDLKVEQRLDRAMMQLDDRFSIFSGVAAGEQAIDHLIIGPTGIYTVKISATDEKDGWARAADIEQLLADTKAVDALLLELIPHLSLKNQSVLCVPTGPTVHIDQESGGVWVVAADTLAVSLIKRSSAEGAIAQNVNETGAFSTDTMESVAVERALAHHWDIPTRKNRTDFLPPRDLLNDSPPEVDTP